MIEKITSSSNRLSSIGYSEADIIKNMCPIELGINNVKCNNENENHGYEGCQKCWYQEFNDN